jgi:hypothetical protein
VDQVMRRGFARLQRAGAILRSVRRGIRPSGRIRWEVSEPVHGWFELGTVGDPEEPGTIRDLIEWLAQYDLDEKVADATVTFADGSMIRAESC